MSETSVAEAETQLTRLIRQAERSDAVHITRRGKPVAVLLSEDECARLCRGKGQCDFWDLIAEMRANPMFEPIDWSRGEIDSWRDYRLVQDFEWPE